MKAFKELGERGHLKCEIHDTLNLKTKGMMQNLGCFNNKNNKIDITFKALKVLFFPRRKPTS